jgi:hypothetical protein
MKTNINISKDDFGRAIWCMHRGHEEARLSLFSVAQTSALTFQGHRCEGPCYKWCSYPPHVRLLNSSHDTTLLKAAAPLCSVRMRRLLGKARLMARSAYLGHIRHAILGSFTRVPQPNLGMLLGCLLTDKLVPEICTLRMKRAEPIDSPCQACMPFRTWVLQSL